MKKASITMRIAGVVGFAAASVILSLGLTACSGDAEDSAGGDEGSGAKTEASICSVYTSVLGPDGLRGLSENVAIEGQGAKYREVAEGIKGDDELKDAWLNYGDYLDLQVAMATDPSKLEEFSEKTVASGEWIGLIGSSIKQCP